MVKAAKFMVLVGGLMGIVAFFLPMATVEGQGQTIKASAFQAVRGATFIEGKAKEVEGSAISAQDKKSAGEVGDFFTKVKSVLYGLYAPAVLLMLLGLIGVIKQKFGRGFAIFSVLLGLVSLAIWGFLFMLAGEVNKDGDTKLTLGLGSHFLLGTGILGFLGGITNTVKPDRD